MTKTRDKQIRAGNQRPPPGGSQMVVILCGSGCVCVAYLPTTLYNSLRGLNQGSEINNMSKHCRSEEVYRLSGGDAGQKGTEV